MTIIKKLKYNNQEIIVKKSLSCNFIILNISLI